MVANKLLCVIKTPFGTPVEPDVYINMARSSFVGGVLAGVGFENVGVRIKN
jgi:hypothetical protein